jgi:hypothetical protein
MVDGVERMGAGSPEDLDSTAAYDAALDVLARLVAGAAAQIEAEKQNATPDLGAIYRWNAVAEISSQRRQSLDPADRAAVTFVLQAGGALARSLSADTP